MFRYGLEDTKRSEENIFELKIGLSLLCNLKKKCHDDLKCQNIATCNVFGTNLTKYFLSTKAWTIVCSSCVRKTVQNNIPPLVSVSDIIFLLYSTISNVNR